VKNINVVFNLASVAIVGASFDMGRKYNLVVMLKTGVELSEEELERCQRQII